ncbi:MAG: LLM class flavin-dependent oxidoreductase [Candidatus Methylomirabilia bacterium]
MSDSRPVRLSAGIQFGVLLPTRGVLFSPGGPDITPIYRMAEAAEAAGYHSAWVGDSVTAKPRLDAVATLAVVAARTERLRLGTAVMLAALRPPVILAHQIASLDVLAGGRLIWGVGAGRGGRAILDNEFAACGVPMHERARRLEELLKICRLLWSGKPVSYSGQHYQLQDVTLEPVPIQNPGVPIWIASNLIERGLKRVAALADAWITNVTTLDVYRQCWEKIGGYARAAGRDRGMIGQCLYLTINVDPDGEAARRQGRSFLEQYYKKSADEIMVDLVCHFGSPEDCAERINGYVREGVRTVILRFAAPNQLEQLVVVTEELLPLFR